MGTRIVEDLRYTLRTLGRQPGLTVIIALSIGLGIAANSTAFSVVNAVLFGDLPVREPARLVTVVRDKNFTMSYPEYEDYRESGAFEGVAAKFPLVPVSLAGSGQAERVWGQVVTPNYFDVLGLQMAQGRGFRADEERAEVVVLSHGLWTGRFGADPNIIGRTVTMNQRSFTVVGVARQGFRGADRMLVAEFWVPLRMVSTLLSNMGGEDRYQQRGHSWIQVDGRIRNGLTHQQALSIVQTVAARVDRDTKRERPRSITLDPAGTWAGQAGVIVRIAMMALMVIAMLVLSIACANVANILLARATGRQKEFSVRLAVGASRWQLISQLLVESTTLSLLGAAVGYGIAFFATGILSQARLPMPLPIEFRFAPDWRVFLFTAGLALLAGILFGLAPAMRSTRPDLISAMRASDVAIAGSRRFGLRNTLVVVQVALSVVLIAGAALFVRSLQNAASVDLGIRPERMFTVAFDPSQHSPDPVRRANFLRELRRNVMQIAGVERVAFVDVLPLSIGGSRSTTHPDHSENIRVDPTLFQVSDGYFAAYGIPILLGRDFTPGEPGSKAVLDEYAASKLFPGTSPLGRRIRTGRQEYEVVGVVRTMKARTVGEEARGIVFMHMEFGTNVLESMLGLTMVVKTARDPGSFATPVLQSISRLDPNLATFNAQTMQQQVDKAFLLPRLAALAFTIFGSIGLLLAAIGLYGVLSFAVRRRTREIGIRMALGAERNAVLAMVAREGLTLIAVGLAIGVPIALGAARLANSLLYGLSATDWVTFTVTPAVLLVVGVIATWVPAQRASKVDPMVALRDE
ncbi:MAG: ABC transporter permease [Acidobacteria bacterium]|nr:ABC transporter permease [Acidobacteriota bacterium]